MSTCSPLPGVLPTSGTAPLTPCSLQGDSWLSSPRRRLYEPEAKFPSYPFEHMPLRDVVSTRRSPGLRPRWCPVHLPQRIQDCCLPRHAERRLSPASQDYPNGPQLYTRLPSPVISCVAWILFIGNGGQVFRGSIQSLWNIPAFAGYP